MEYRCTILRAPLYIIEYTITNRRTCARFVKRHTTTADQLHTRRTHSYTQRAQPHCNTPHSHPLSNTTVITVYIEYVRAGRDAPRQWLMTGQCLSTHLGRVWRHLIDDLDAILFQLLLELLHVCIVSVDGAGEAPDNGSLVAQLGRGYGSRLDAVV